MPVLATADPNDTSAKFFVRLTGTQGISDISGNGVVPPTSTAVAEWLLIPAPGAAGTSPLGREYLIGAMLQYKFAGEVHARRGACGHHSQADAAHCAGLRTSFRLP